MATITYLIKGTKNPASVYVRFKNGRMIDLSTSTSLLVNPKHWSKAKKKVKVSSDAPYASALNLRLDKLSSHIIEAFNESNSEGEVIDARWYKKMVAGFFNRSVVDNDYEMFLMAYMEKFLETADSRFLRDKNRPVSENTVKKYKTTYNALLAFEKWRGKRILFKQVDLAFHKELMNYMKGEMRYGNNTIGKHVSLIKFFCKEAKGEGVSINEQVFHRDFYQPREITKDVYLNEEEIKRVFEHDFSDNDKLNNVRDLFIIGLHTGLRVSDFLRLKSSDIDGRFIEIETKKTGKVVRIAIHKHLEQVLEKYKGELPRTISSQKFNEYVKEVCQEVGLDEMVEGKLMNPVTNRKEDGTFPKYKLISSHTCRRSFASNLYGKLNTQTIMAITGHTTEKSFIKYIKITPKEHAETLARYWEGQRQIDS